jgi:hypothetical protein
MALAESLAKMTRMQTLTLVSQDGGYGPAQGTDGWPGLRLRGVRYTARKRAWFSSEKAAGLGYSERVCLQLFMGCLVWVCFYQGSFLCMFPFFLRVCMREKTNCDYSVEGFLLLIQFAVFQSMEYKELTAFRRSM